MDQLQPPYQLLGGPLGAQPLAQKDLTQNWEVFLWIQAEIAELDRGHAAVGILGAFVHSKKMTQAQRESLYG